MTTPTTIRRATRADLPLMARMLVDAFAPGPWGRFLFPGHLRVTPGDEDEVAWRQHTLAEGLDSPARDTVLACQGQGDGEIVGWSQWIDLAALTKGSGGGGLNPEEMKVKTDDRDSGLARGPNPPGLDLDALNTLRTEGQELEKKFKEFLGAERAAASLQLNYLVVEPKHQRKGIGRLLVKEGLDQAARQGRDVCLRATPEGRPLYLALGFEEICEQKVIGGSQYAMVMKAPDLDKTTG
ncbi:hypothetical protein DHEL01_v204488 [Diaporthe helianthi]|uniref:N-acetyltransferase domain-containing protein n=1 Tax=Diaporthe helianthi TaxID=158607 RepID=A0A2P5I3R8_DIAHE|nr:hypothetical protein DHEL01_v204488 [Diaporthe helianthi]